MASVSNVNLCLTFTNAKTRGVVFRFTVIFMTCIYKKICISITMDLIKVTTLEFRAYFPHMLIFILEIQMMLLQQWVSSSTY